LDYASEKIIGAAKYFSSKSEKGNQQHSIMNRIKLSLLSALGITALFAGNALAEINVAASFSITEDIVHEIGGDRVKVTAVIPRGSNPHSYSLRPRDLMTLEKADIVFLTGLGFDDYLKRWASAPEHQKKIVDISRGIKPIQNENDDHEGEDHENEHEHHAGHEHHHHGTDPHAWQNPLNGAVYAENIQRELCKREPDSCAFFTGNAENYIKALKNLDSRYQELFARVPDKNRIMITTHDAFNYLADRYRITILAPRGITDSHEPSAGDIAAIEKLMKENKVHAVFIENLAANAAVEDLSRKNGRVINGMLFTDSLAEEPEGNTYLRMIEHNLRVIHDAMSQ
jgi:zinc/manganese transport system substrate-binding protein